jgi:hypothetical protein
VTQKIDQVTPEWFEIRYRPNDEGLVLVFVRGQWKPPKAAQIADVLGLDRPHVEAILTELVDIGAVERRIDGTYRTFGARAPRQDVIPRAAPQAGAPRTFNATFTQIKASQRDLAKRPPGKRKLGAESAYTLEVGEQVAQVVRDGRSVHGAGVFLKIPDGTLRDWLKKIPSFRRMIEDARGKK